MLDSKSGRSSRICLAAGACAADEGNDRACYINTVMTELLHQQPAYKGEMRLRALHATSAKSLYDALVAENLSLTEKRATMNMRSIQQVLTPAQIHRLPTTLMVADGLTKHDLKLQDSLRQWCNMPRTFSCEMTNPRIARPPSRCMFLSNLKQRPVKNPVCFWLQWPIQVGCISVFGPNSFHPNV